MGKSPELTASGVGIKATAKVPIPAISHPKFTFRFAESKGLPGIKRRVTAHRVDVSGALRNTKKPPHRAANTSLLVRCTHMEYSTRFGKFLVHIATGRSDGLEASYSGEGAPVLPLLRKTA